MRITIVQGAFFPVPPLLGGAVEKVWFALGKEFARQGHTVVHISRAIPSLPKRETIDGVQHLRIAGFDQPRSAALLKLFDLIYSLRVRRMLPAADILVTNTFALPLLVRTRRYGRLYIHVQRTPKGQMRYYAHAARLLAVSRAIADAIAQESAQLAPLVRVIPNALPFPITDVAEAPRAKTILYVGRIHPEKGLEQFLGAAQELPRTLADWTIEIVGPHDVRNGGGGDEFLARLRQLAERSVLPVKFMGPVFDQSHLNARYRAASLFVYPSVAEAGEALPVAPLEAMANGCPPLVSELACFRDYIEDGVTGFVFDQQSLSARLTTILQMRPGELRRIGNAAQQRVRQFAVEPVARQYLADFESLVGNG